MHQRFNFNRTNQRKPESLATLMNRQNYANKVIRNATKQAEADYKIITKQQVALQSLRIVDNTRYTTSNGELILPQEVLNLIDNKLYLPRHKKLARDYGMDYLLKLAELARTKGKPSHWYAKCTSLKNWKQTETMLVKLITKLEQLKERLQAIGVDNNYIGYYYNAQKRLSEYLFNRCIELATDRGISNRKHYFAKAISESLAGMKQQPAS